MRNNQFAPPLALMVAALVAVAPVLAGQSATTTDIVTRIANLLPSQEPVEPKCNLNSRPPTCCPPICGDDSFMSKDIDSTQSPSPSQERRKRDSSE